MSAKVRSSEETPAPDLSELEVAKCECCGLMEECTPAYADKIRAEYHGHWICGLCAEAIKDEIRRSGWAISTEDAMDRHRRFFKSFRSVSPPAKSAEHLIAAVSRLLRRSLSSPAIPLRNVDHDCFAALDR
ncbi:uncharacterized protein [Typha angustifolia]|uniref:uncharacterized protein n=1 Tax=Typha angustifolia TaxID=59011 RepID=UPI003C3096EF